jgi:hypothetical protein
LTSYWRHPTSRTEREKWGTRQVAEKELGRLSI